MPHKHADSVKPGDQFTFEGQTCIRIDVSGPKILDAALGKNMYYNGDWHPEVLKTYEWSFKNISLGLGYIEVGGYVLAFNTETHRLLLLKHSTSVGIIE